MNRLAGRSVATESRTSSASAENSARKCHWQESGACPSHRYFGSGCAKPRRLLGQWSFGTLVRFQTASERRSDPL